MPSVGPPYLNSPARSTYQWYDVNDFPRIGDALIWKNYEQSLAIEAYLVKKDPLKPLLYVL